MRDGWTRAGRLAVAALLLTACGWGAAESARAHPPRRHGAELDLLELPVPAQPFALVSLAGGTLRLADLRGKTVLLNFWATWCLPCVREMPALQRAAQAMAGRDFVVLAVSQDSDGASKVRPFAARLGLTLPIALDADNAVGDSYGASELPMTFLIDPRGRVVAKAVGGRAWDGAGMLSYFRELAGARR